MLHIRANRHGVFPGSGFLSSHAPRQSLIVSSEPDACPMAAGSQHTQRSRRSDSVQIEMHANASVPLTRCSSPPARRCSVWLPTSTAAAAAIQTLRTCAFSGPIACGVPAYRSSTDAALVLASRTSSGESRRV